MSHPSRLATLSRIFVGARLEVTEAIAPISVQRGALPDEDVVVVDGRWLEVASDAEFASVLEVERSSRLARFGLLLSPLSIPVNANFLVGAGLVSR